ncbi:MAG: hypothetical protein Q8P04_02265 [bacterium]|nr:hypothetical protein [bacterium]
MYQGNKLLVTLLIIIIALAAGGSTGFFFGQRNPTFQSLPQILPHIPNEILAKMANTSAVFRNPEFRANAAGSIVQIAGATITIAGNDANGIRIETNGDTVFVDVSQNGTEAPVALSAFRVGDNVLIQIKVADSRIIADKVTRQ